MLTRTKRTAAKDGRRGTALVIALIAIFALLGIGLALHQMAHATNRQARRELDERHAFHLAEAGITEAMVALRAGMPGNVASAAAPAFLDGGVVWVEATDLGGGQSRLVAHAAAGSGRSALEAIVDLDLGAPLFPSVLNSKDQLTLNSSVLIDSYDSEVGTYASQAVNTYGIHTYANQNGDVSSNADIVLNSNATVLGDATPGVANTVSFAAGSYVSGSTAQATTPFTFPPISPPAIPVAGDMILGNGAAGALPAGDYGFGQFNIGKDAVLTITGPANVLLSDFTGGKDAQLIVDATAGPVTFYVTGNYSHINGFEVLPAPGSPIATAFLVQGSANVVFPGNTNIRGAFYAPNADILFAAGNEAWGAFAGKSVNMSSGMKFHYDESLTKHWQNNASSQSDPLEFLSWRPTNIAPVMQFDRRDPFAILGIAPGAMATPAASWN